MKARCGYLLILALLPTLAALATPGQAAIDLSAQATTTGLRQDAKFKPPDKVFQFNARAAGPHTIRAHWDIADGYYLYRGRFHFSLSQDARASLGAPRFPRGESESDPYFGKIVVYRHAVNVLIPVHGAAPGAQLHLNVIYQGCADAGFCYPPIKHAANIRLLARGAAQPAPEHAAQAPAHLSRQSRLAHLIVTSHLAFVMLVFAGLGLLLAFTPCVLPMLPILSGLIVGHGKRMTSYRAFALSLVYVLVMALTYTAVGVAAGLTGANLQAAFQTPWVILLFSAVFIALSLSMFGVYELRMPAIIQGRAIAASNRQARGTFLGAGVMGVLSALIVGPCLAAPLAGTLLVISQGGDAVRGGLALFALSIGMGLPLLAIGASAGRLLPRAGAWMDAVKQAFGVLLLGTAVWFLSRILPSAVTLGLWGLLAVVAAVALGVFQRRRIELAGWRILSLSLSLLVLIYGMAMLVGAWAGGGDPLRPLAPLTHGAAPANTEALAFKRIKSVRDLHVALGRAAQHDKPVMLDFYADWCVSCKELEHTTFENPRVRRALQRLVLLRADVTANDAKDQALLKHFGIFGPPSIMFFDREGEQIKQDRVVGYLSAADFLPHIPAVASHAPAPRELVSGHE